MITPRAIPLLELLDGKLVKTTQFQNPKYIGDPLNAVTIFSNQQADEIMFVDIKKQRSPNLDVLKHVVSECFIPFAYGGSIHSVQDALDVVKWGADKVILGTSAPAALITGIADELGSQSVVVSSDWIIDSDLDPVEVMNIAAMACQHYNSLGAGEVLLRDINRDGMMCGYNSDLMVAAKACNFPVVISDGASSYDDICEVHSNGLSCAASSVFIYNDKNRQVLVNYEYHHRQMH